MFAADVNAVPMLRHDAAAMFDDHKQCIFEADAVVLSISQTVEWEVFRRVRRLSYARQILRVLTPRRITAQPDIFVGVTCIRAPRFVIDAIAAAGHEGIRCIVLQKGS